jgi:acyl-coenzyme A synthetase/AMP-(fatty) acid ligase
MYGATEASARLTYLDPAYFESKLGSIGTPIPDVTIQIVDEQNRNVPDGSQGELVASGPNIMQGYWKDPQYTSCVLDDQGYHTGDIGYRDENGFLYILRRKDGMLKVGGHRINPVEVEDFLMATDLIIETAVVGLPDSLLGHKLVALVVPQDGIDAPKTLMQKCADGLPSHKCPSTIISVRALPKNANGKIDQNTCITIATQQIQ